jgi:hypothetical protein
MSLPIPCPSCKRRLYVPEKLAGRRVTCPRCGEAVRAVLPEEPAQEAPTHPAATSTAAAAAADEAPLSTRLGITALVLGLLSILILCVPVVGYGSLGLSGIGFLFAVAGLVCARNDRTRGVRPPLPAEGQGLPAIGKRDLNYSLGGMVVCLLAEALALLPFLFQ